MRGCIRLCMRQPRRAPGGSKHEYLLVLGTTYSRGSLPVSSSAAVLTASTPPGVASIQYMLSFVLAQCVLPWVASHSAEKLTHSQKGSCN